VKEKRRSARIGNRRSVCRPTQAVPFERSSGAGIIRNRNTFANKVEQIARHVLSLPRRSALVLLDWRTAVT